MYFTGASTVSIENCTFRQNVANGAGSAIFNDNSHSFSIGSNVFTFPGKLNRIFEGNTPEQGCAAAGEKIDGIEDGTAACSACETSTYSPGKGYFRCLTCPAGECWRTL